MKRLIQAAVFVCFCLSGADTGAESFPWRPSVEDGRQVVENGTWTGKGINERAQAICGEDTLPWDPVACSRQDLLWGVAGNVLGTLSGSFINTTAYPSWPPSEWPTNGWEMCTGTGLFAVAAGYSISDYYAGGEPDPDIGNWMDYWVGHTWRDPDEPWQIMRGMLERMKYWVPPDFSSVYRNWSYSCYRSSEIVSIPGGSIDADSFCAVDLCQGCGGLEQYPAPSWGQGPVISESIEVNDYHYSDRVMDGASMSGGSAYNAWGPAQQNCIAQNGVQSFAYASMQYTNMPTLYYLAYVGPYISDGECDTNAVPDTSLSYSGKKAVAGDMTVDGRSLVHSAMMDGPTAPGLNTSPQVVVVHIPDDINSGGCPGGPDISWSPYYSIDAQISREHAYIIEWDFDFD